MSSGQPITLVDLREPEETALLALPFALHIPLPDCPSAGKRSRATRS